jgi:hypothetical protein
MKNSRDYQAKQLDNDLAWEVREDDKETEREW